MKEKIIIYQVLPRLFGNTNLTNKKNGSIAENGVGKFSNFDSKTLKEIKKMGFNYIWYTGVLEHATKTDYSAYGIKQDHPDVIKGTAGSPYAIKDYYDVCPDLADDVNKRIEEFEELIERTHKAGLKVIIDFVPNHVAREYRSDKRPKGVKDFGEKDNKEVHFAPDNNYYYFPNQRLELDFKDVYQHSGYMEFPAKATGNDCFSNRTSVNDWYETVKLNYGVDYRNNRAKHFDPIPDTWNKMKEILLYWAAKGVDAFRCDMMEMVPAEFWGWVIPKVKQKNKEILFIGEAYDNGQYEDYIFNGKFDYLYDKVDLYDTVRDVICGHKPTSEITFSWQKVEKVQQYMLNFLENHDEQRIASDFFAGDASKAIPALHVLSFMNSNPLMIYFGQELGEKGMDEEGFSGLDGRTTIFDYWAVDSIVKWRNGGTYDGATLSEDQKKLRAEYLKTLQIANEEKCITEGAFYDLMYANYSNDLFDSTKQYAFLRVLDNEFLLIVSNFSDQEVSITVNIPSEAFEYMGIASTQVKSAKELLTKKTFSLKGVDFSNIPVFIEAFASKIIKFKVEK